MEGFEPPDPFGPAVFKTAAINRTRPHFREDWRVSIRVPVHVWCGEGESNPHRAFARGF